MQPLDKARLRAEIRAAVNQPHMRTDARKIERILQRGVAPADDRHIPPAEERAVADGAIGHAAMREAFLARYAEMAALGARCKNDGPRVVGLLPRRQAEPVGGLLRCLDAPLNERRTEGKHLLPHGGRKRRARSAGQPRIVFDLGGEDHLPAADLPLKHKHGQPRAAGVNRGAHPCGSCADNRNIVHFASEYNFFP